MTEPNSAPADGVTASPDLAEPRHSPDAPTRRGVHDLLRTAAAQHVDTGPGTAATGYRPGRTLSLRVEAARQLRRRRTQIVGLVVVALPILLALAFKLGGANPGSGGSSGGSGSTLVNLATVGAANFAMFTEFATVGFLLVVIVALFCGDTVASEASWSSLRYLLSIPVPRSRLLRQKLTVAIGFTIAVNVLMPVWAYLIGGAFFGWAPARSPVSGEFDNTIALQRLAIVIAYAAVQALIVASLAFWLSVMTDAPLGAVGGATFVVVISNIIDSITALGSYRQYLPTHFQYSWLDALGPTVVWDDMIRGTGVTFVYVSVLLLATWSRFLRKDITS